MNAKVEGPGAAPDAEQELKHSYDYGYSYGYGHGYSYDDGYNYYNVYDDVCGCYCNNDGGVAAPDNCGLYVA